MDGHIYWFERRVHRRVPLVRLGWGRGSRQRGGAKIYVYAACLQTSKQAGSQKNNVSASPATKQTGEGEKVKEGYSTVHWERDVRDDLTTSILIFSSSNYIHFFTQGERGLE